MIIKADNSNEIIKFDNIKKLLDPNYMENMIPSNVSLKFLFKIC